MLSEATVKQKDLKKAKSEPVTPKKTKSEPKKYSKEEVLQNVADLKELLDKKDSDVTKEAFLQGKGGSKKANTKKEDAKQRFFKVYKPIQNGSAKYTLEGFEELSKSNRYKGTPYSAARKVVRHLTRKMNSENTVRFVLRETTREKDNALYFYEGSRVKISGNGKEYKFVDKNTGNERKFSKNYDIKVRSIPATELKHANPLTSWK